MITIALQMILCLLLAALIGFVVGWLLRKIACAAHEKKSRTEINTLRAERQKLQDELMRSKAALASSSKPAVSIDDAALRQDLMQCKTNLRALELQGEEKARIIRQLNVQLNKPVSVGITKAELVSSDNLDARNLDAGNLEAANSNSANLNTAANSAELARLAAQLQGKEIELRSCEARLQDAVRMLQTGGSATSSTVSAEPPRQYQAAPSSVDNLEEIYGVGPVLSKMLNRLGIYTFKQVARWSEADIAFFDSQLEQFHGRIKRENWIASAREEHFKKYGEKI